MSHIIIPETHTIHLVLKYGKHIAPKPGTIALHKQVIKEYGCVWIGKWGRIVGNPLKEALTKQINDGIKTYVFLAARESGAYLIHAGELVGVATHVNDDKLIPEYYRNEKSSIKTWFNISKLTRLAPNVFNELIGLSSRLPINQTLKKSMAGILLVIWEKHQQIEDFMYEEKG